MNLLEKLLAQGVLSPLSYFFADFIAARSGDDIESLLACSAALVSENNLAGDVCIDMNAYLERPLFLSDNLPAKELPRVSGLEQWRQSLLESPCVGNPGETTPLILDQHRLYLHRYWHYENCVAESILKRLSSRPDVDIEHLSQQLVLLFADDDQDEGVNPQKIAVALAVSRLFVAISGGPGTGKTTTVIKILALMLTQQPTSRIQLAAPTGKAAARMMDAISQRINDPHISDEVRALIPRQASTLHRLLGYRNHRFRYSRQNPLALDCLVIDEASMLDLTLMHHLLEALPDTARIILLGDRDQLASVAAGNVLGDITGHGQAVGYSAIQADQLAALLKLSKTMIPTAKETSETGDSIALLTRSYRFSESSGIGQLASLINQGQSNKVIDFLARKDTQPLLQVPSGDSLSPDSLEWITQLYQPILQSEDAGMAMDYYDRARVLSAIHTGPFGVDEINRLITSRLEPKYHSDGDDYKGRPIMVIANDYDLELYNGDTGLLWPDRNGSLRACFRSSDNSIRELPIHSLPAHVTAWAMTVHKAQGSEFESVLLVLPGNEDSQALSRELIYTAVTRSRANLHIHSPVEVLARACEKLTSRASGLANKLGWKNV
jgi:exodeoxyribonuclease V alpha subunit